MPASDNAPGKADKALGMDESISRRDFLRAAPFGRIAVANTDLAGIMDHRCSILEAERAVGQLLDQVLTA